MCEWAWERRCCVGTPLPACGQELMQLVWLQSAGIR